LRQVFDVLHRERVKVMVSVATVAEVPVFEGSLLRFMEGD
jgi:hypothetical protein